MSTFPAVSTHHHNTRSFVLGLSSAVFVLAFFGTMWSLWASSIIPKGTDQLIYYGAIVLIAIVMFVAGFMMMRTGRSLPEETSPESRAQRSIEGRRYGRVFGLVFGLEILFIIIASFICSNVFHNERAVAPVTAIIVGLHFLPLAKLFNVWPYYVTGSLMTLLGLVTLLAIPVNTAMGAGYAWIGVPGIGGALTLYVTGIVAWFMSRTAASRVVVEH